MEESESRDYDGFEMPNYTQTPNEFYDNVLKHIDTLSELKVTLTIIRRTFGWHKDSDKISQQQLVEKTGMTLKAVKRGIERAIERGTVVKVSDFDRKKNQAVEYGLNFENLDIDKEDKPSPPSSPGGGDKPEGDNPQEAGGDDNRETSPLSSPGTKKRNKVLNKLASYGLDENSSIANGVNKVWVNARSDTVHQLSTYLDDGINKLPIILAVIKTQEESEKEDKKIANKLNYCKGILDDWLKKKVHTVDDVIEDDKKFEKLKQEYEKQSRDAPGPVVNQETKINDPNERAEKLGIKELLEKERSKYE